MTEYTQARPPYRIGHIHLKVANLERSIAFYTSILPLAVTERVHDTYAFLSFGEAHHDLALQEVGEEAPRPSVGSIGLFHTAFEVASKRALADVYTILQQRGIPALTVDYGISWALYVADPDGNGVEIYVDTRDSREGRSDWNGASRRLTAEQILSVLKEADR